MALISHITDNFYFLAVLTALLTFSGYGALRGKWWGFLFIILFGLSIVENIINSTFYQGQALLYGLSVTAAAVICWFLHRPNEKTVGAADPHGEHK